MTSTITAQSVAARKGREPIAMVTAYDYPTARIADEAGVDVILVGDSAGMVVRGWNDTTRVTLDMQVLYTAAVAEARPRALVVGDLPWMTYHVSRERTLDAAAALVRAGATAVKLEGGRKRLDMVTALLDAEIPVMGHLGLTPQSVHVFGGLNRVQAKSEAAVRDLLADADALADAGCFAVVLEGIPAEVAKLVTERVRIPTIGIGAGPHCDGQVLVIHDLLGLEDRIVPKFVRRYANLKAEATAAVARYVADVKSGSFPSLDESYRADPDLVTRLAPAPAADLIEAVVAPPQRCR